MKKILLASFAFAMLLFASCSKSDTTAITTTQVSNTATSGTWKITYYFNSSLDKTSNYSGYTFTFSSNGTVSASNGILSIPGTWSVGVDDSKVKVFLTFTNPASFAQLSNDWEVVERTDVKIRMQDVSGGGGGTDYLTFEKN